MTDTLIDGFKAVATASVADAEDKIAGNQGFISYEIKARINDKKIVGRAVTILEGAS